MPPAIMFFEPSSRAPRQICHPGRIKTIEAWQESAEVHHYIHIYDSQTPKTRNRNISMNQVHAKGDQYLLLTSQETHTATKLNIPAIPISKILESTRFSFDIVNWTMVKRAPNAPDMRISTNDPENATLEEMAEATLPVRMRVSRE